MLIWNNTHLPKLEKRFQYVPHLSDEASQVSFPSSVLELSVRHQLKHSMKFYVVFCESPSQADPVLLCGSWIIYFVEGSNSKRVPKVEGSSHGRDLGWMECEVSEVCWGCYEAHWLSSAVDKWLRLRLTGYDWRVVLTVSGKACRQVAVWWFWIGKVFNW